MTDLANISDEAPKRAPSHARSMQFLGTNWSLCLIFAIMAGYIVFSTSNSGFDNDMWWLLASGREVVENGIPYINPWSIHEGLETVVQQWLAAVVLYETYNAFGLLGLKVLVVLQSVVLFAVLFALCRIVSGRRHGSGETFSLVIAVAFVSFSAYLSVRPHVYSMALFAAVLCVLELYRLRHKRAVLVLLPVLTCIHVNVHAAMAPFDLFIIALYLVPDLPSMLRKRGQRVATTFYRMDYRRLPLFIALVAAALALLVNPYGMRGALYLVLSYGAAGYGNYINEMGSTGFWTSYGGGTMAMIVLGAAAIGHNGMRRADVPLSILFLVCIPLSMMHTRNVWLVALFAIPLFARSFANIRVNTDTVWFFNSKLANGVIAAIVFVGALSYAATQQWPTYIENAESDTSSLPSKATDYLDTYVEMTGVAKRDLRIYNSFNCGGWLEWRGYRVFMDPRPELWEPGITGNERHYYQEFVDFAQDKATPASVVDEYNFDFVIAYSNSELNKYMGKSDNYVLACSGSGYQMWARTDLNVDTTLLDKVEQEQTTFEAAASEMDSIGNTEDLLG